MNSLTYLSRQFDVLASTPPSTPPSTPNTEHEPLPALKRAKSFAKTSRRNPSANASGSATGFHSPKRSFSSPSLFASRKQPPLSILSVLSSAEKMPVVVVPTPPIIIPPTPTTKHPSSTTPHRKNASRLSSWLLIRSFVVLWDTVSATSAWIAHQTGLVNFEVRPQTADYPDTGMSGEEKIEESEEDDPIVARAKPSSSTSSSMKFPSLLDPDPLAVRPPPISFEPPSVEEVQRQTETPKLPDPSTTTSTSDRLLPNPLSGSLLMAPSSRSRTSSSPQPQTTVARPSSSPTPPLRKTPLHLPKTLVLDLDETLIHSTSRPPMSSFSSAGTGLLGLGGLRGARSGGRGHTVEVVLGGRSTLYHVYKRPFVDYFLRKVSTWYTLVIFTASMQEYADPVIDWLDAGRGILGRRLFRESCTQLPNGSYTKDLSIIERDLSRICLVDNSPISYGINPANGIPIEGWISDPSDEALLDLLPVLDSLRFTGDVRRILGIRGFSFSSSAPSSP